MFAPEPACGTKAPQLPKRPEKKLPLIVTAIEEEFEAISRFVSGGERQRAGEAARGILLGGRIRSTTILLAMTGDGPARAAASVSLLLGEFPVSFLVGAGAAGALHPSLGVGEIVVATRVVDEAVAASGPVPAPGAALLARAEALGARPAAFVQAARPLCSSKEKKALAERFGLARAGAGPAVVDMESSAWARAAGSRGVSYVMLRAVSDTFEEDLPAFLSSCLSPEGSVDRGAVARRLVLHPAALPKLLRTRRRVREGAEALGRFLERLLPEMI